MTLTMDQETLQDLCLQWLALSDAYRLAVYGDASRAEIERISNELDRIEELMDGEC